MQSILIVDDMESIHEMLDTFVQPLGYATRYASNGNDAIKAYQEERPDIVLTDIKMSPMDGLEFAKKLKEIDPEVIIIMMSGYASMNNALTSLKMGAFDYLTKPFKIDQLMAAISRASKLIQSKQSDQGDGSSNFLVGDSAAAKSLKEAIEHVSKSSSPVLLQGEKNTQKSLVAAKIGQNQAREDSNAPFVAFDCNENDANSIREKLLGGTLIKEAEGGSLLIENIENLPKEFQSEVAETIQANKTQTRFIFSTSENLERLVEKDAFDDSLYYRISSHSIDVPSLKERSKDIPLIAKAILRNLGKDEIQIDDHAKSLLQSYRWPGNFKELQEAIEHAAANCSDGTIQAESLPERIRDLSEWSKLTDYIEEATLEYKRRVLQACHGDLELAAEVLGCEQEQLPNS
ncbi:MAG: two-component system response regulator HydG [Candidatus Pelagisphaera sp.]|jgi:two-component system response regulator HydG